MFGQIYEPNDLKNIVFLEMLIFSEIWTKMIFKSDLKQRSFSRNVDIF